MKEILRDGFEGQELDVKVQLILELIPIGLMHIEKMLQEEVEELAGEWYKRNGSPGYVHWTR